MASPSDWLPLELVMIVEQRTCRCGATHEVPSPAIFLREQAPGTTNLRMQRLNGGDIPPILPPVLEYVAVTCPICPSCFIERYNPTRRHHPSDIRIAGGNFEKIASKKRARAIIESFDLASSTEQWE